MILKKNDFFMLDSFLWTVIAIIAYHNSTCSTCNYFSDGDQSNDINDKEPLIASLVATADRDREPAGVHEMSVCQSLCDSEEPDNRSDNLHYDVDVESTIDDKSNFERCLTSATGDLSLRDRDFALPK